MFKLGVRNKEELAAKIKELSTYSVIKTMEKGPLAVWFLFICSEWKLSTPRNKNLSSTSAWMQFNYGFLELINLGKFGLNLSSYGTVVERPLSAEMTLVTPGYVDPYQDVMH